MKLINGVEQNRLHPKTFEIPDASEISNCTVGSYVKIGITDDSGNNGERFWVEITAIDGDAFVGRVDNDLVRTDVHGLKLNDTVSFKSENILNIY